MRTLLLALLLSLAVPATVAAADPAPTSERTCFFSSNWYGWSAPRGGDVLYLRVGLHDVYRVQLARGTHVYRYPDRFLVNRVRGSNWICSPLDLDLTLNDHDGFSQGLIARDLRKLTPEEVAAIPVADRPY